MISPAFWLGRRVLLTGHTGFKGAWTALLLKSLGAEVYGLALAPTGDQDIFNVAGLAADIHHALGDIRDPATVDKAFQRANPQIVLHMAAQSLVRPSYADPVATYATNVLGAVHVLDAARRSPGVQAIVVVTSDKCYENTGQKDGYREGDALGGYDPYSNSKACAELVTAAYRRSFFGRPGGQMIASARAGNVIGGGDWAVDRLVPDAMRAFGAKAALGIRNPQAIRPWQHVLDPVIAYLLLAERLAAKDADFAEAWNFGPGPESEVPVSSIADLLVRNWGPGASWRTLDGNHPHEAPLLKLDCSKARARLGWRPLLGLNQAMTLTVDWYKALQHGADMRALSLKQIDAVLRPTPVAHRVA